MKDYRLSEIKAICEKNHEVCSAKKCELFSFCVSTKMPYHAENYENIEPRDMIELPCKQYASMRKCWFVFYRDAARDVLSMFCGDEAEADAFLAELKGEQR